MVSLIVLYFFVFLRERLKDLVVCSTQKRPGYLLGSSEKAVASLIFFWVGRLGVKLFVSTKHRQDGFLQMMGWGGCY